MAHVRLTADRQTPFVLNVDAAVGPNCSNRRDDVQLVQFFLSTILATRPNYPAVAIDGVCRSVTAQAIRDFQQLTRDRGRQCVVDGRVDRMVQSVVGRVSGAQLTIVWLNIAFLSLAGQRCDLCEVPYDARCPADLRHARCCTFERTFDLFAASGE